jgi:hypothetical protein
MRKKPELGEKLLGILSALKRLGAASYPPTLSRLVELTDDTPATVTQALTTKEMKARVELSRGVKAAQAAPEDTLVMLAEDDDRRDFAARFDQAFAALDRAAGGYNYVTLRALRSALPDVPRAKFDEGLAALRRSRRYTLDPAHGTMTKADRDAGIMEAGNLLMYVARRRS